MTERKDVCRLGGLAVPADKRSFSRDPELARRAGAKGGKAVRAEDRSFSQNRELAARAGRKGGQTRARRAALADGIDSSWKPGDPIRGHTDPL